MASFLISDVRFDGESVIENGSVLVEDGRISTVSSTSIDFSGISISKPGHTLLPGLIDAHVHVDFGNESGLAQGLRFGVTTQCDLGNAPFQIQRLREMVKEGNCSDIKACMQSATPEGGWPSPLLKKQGIELPPDENPLQTSQQGHEFVRTQKSAGADFIKILHESGIAFGMELPTLSSNVEKAIIEEAHRSDLIVLAHAFTHDDALHMLSLGIDGTAHAVLDRPPNDHLIEAYLTNNAFCIPTLAVIGSNTAEGQETQKKFANDPRVQNLLASDGRQRLCQCIGMTDASQGSLHNAIELVRKLRQSGIDVICGTDSTGLAPGTAYGLSLHQELAMFVKECGFSPVEALRSATRVAAKRLNFRDRGLIREGMRADLVLVEGDPTKNIDITLNLRGVWADGKLCSYYTDGLE